jgi:hypothetical protein
MHMQLNVCRRLVGSMHWSLVQVNVREGKTDRIYLTYLLLSSHTPLHFTTQSRDTLTR